MAVGCAWELTREETHITVADEEPIPGEGAVGEEGCAVLQIIELGITEVVTPANMTLATSG